ncbi:hypothetical protein AMTRI_Chr02g258720 [Amborella trichopoda]
MLPKQVPFSKHAKHEKRIKAQKQETQHSPFLSIYFWQTRASLTLKNDRSPKEKKAETSNTLMSNNIKIRFPKFTHARALTTKSTEKKWMHPLEYIVHNRLFEQ